MRHSSKEKANKPLHTPTGERIYELIGGKKETGGTKLHSLAQVGLPEGKSSAPHYHREREETYYMLKGKARMRVDEREFILEAGQACLIEPGEVHQIFNESSKTVEFLAVCAPPWAPEDQYEV